MGKTAIYLRLSVDDGPNRESNSITNQRDILMRYVDEHGFGYTVEYADDGFSGILFARPAFQQMISDVEDGKIGTILVKDLSRFGRNNTLISYYLDIVFPEHNTRLIAVDDNIDTHANTDGLVLNIKSILNEMYVKEASKKIRSAQRQIAERGEFMAKPPYGYIKQNKRLIADPATAPNVPLMFQMADNYNTIDEIANRFGVSYERIRHILKNPSYLGDTVNFKYSTISFKVKAYVEESDWVVKRGTHEALIDELLFRRVQEKLKIRRRLKTIEAAQVGGLFDGILTCVVCGGTMLSLAGGNYRCQVCYQHTIDGGTLIRDITADIHRQTSLLKTMPAELARLRRDASAVRAGVKRAIINDAPDSEVIELQQRRAEFERLIDQAEDMLERARLAANKPNDSVPESVRALVERVTVHNNNRVQITYKKG
jgi:DNA invertase Pin-like site-specific DNA recombinase